MKKLVAVFAVVLAFPVLAQTERVVQEPDREVAAKVTIIEISCPSEVEGSGYTSGGIRIVAKKPFVFENLIRVRSNFRAELQQSADKL